MVNEKGINLPGKFKRVFFKDMQDLLGSAYPSSFNALRF